jgi:hypothetical protein
MPAEANASILPAEGFRVENGKKDPLPGLELNMYADRLMFFSRSDGGHRYDNSDHYRTHFAGKKQIHFVGYLSSGAKHRL